VFSGVAHLFLRTKRQSLSRLRQIVILGVVVVALVCWSLLLPATGAMAGAVSVYVAGLALMAVSGVMTKLHSWLTAAGGALFLASDGLLAFNRFGLIGPDKAVLASLAIWVLYVLAVWALFAGARSGLQRHPRADLNAG
jgi:uncharacterized membrane protein YhhN